ncbi:uncharacterized protein LOC132557731 [Ylistrum balloti]|uniref:uncharacterized protein LOC132557731 n=1 Tax=Ylistrum balloti TaxID=509963 RepID=UPI0029058288|nr:uncharacterized protein LOC132557731 [Ylistrum balloti]
MTLNFDLPETCVDTPSLKAKLTASLSTLNFVWSRSLCEQSDCSNEVTDVECQDTRKIGVNVQLHLVPGDIKNSITNTASTPSELLAAAIDNKELTIQGSVADVMSLDILIQGPSCLDRHQVVGNYCVECGQGTYFSFQSKTCELCAKGHYQNLWGQTSCKSCPDNSPTTWGQGTTSISNCYIECTSGHYYDYRDGIKTCLACPRGTYQPLDGSFYCLECGLDLTTASSGTKDSKDCIDLDLTSTEADNNEASGRSMAADEGLSDDIVIVIAVLCFLILIVLVIFILVCLCKEKISFLNYNDVDPDELTQKSRFGEAKIDFITRRLNKVRHQRGAQPINDKRYQRQSYHYHDDTSYYEDDPMSPRHYQHLPSQYVRYPRENESYAASIHLRKYEESLTDGHTTKRSRRLAPLDGSRPAEVITKSKSKKKRKSGKESRKKVNKELHGESEAPTKTHEVPLNVLPDSSELKESGWSEGRTKNKTSTHVQPEINPNTFSDSEASDVDIGRIGRKSKKTSQA